MARISLIAPETASPEVREIYDTVLRGKPGNIQKALAHRPEMLKHFLTFYASVGRSLDRKLYEHQFCYGNRHHGDGHRVSPNWLFGPA